MSQDLLIEIGTEELPPSSLRALERGFLEGIAAGLVAQGIDHGRMEGFCTPRRLAVLVRGVAASQTARNLVRRGPAVASAFDTGGQPSKALEGFARSCGVSVSQLHRESTEKGEWMVFRKTEPGGPTTELVPALVQQALAGLPIAKRMRWGLGEAEFVRPVHWVCMVLGDQVIPGSVLGVAAAALTYGHRFHVRAPLVVAEAGLYPDILRNQGFVEPSFDRRKELIAFQVAELAAANGVRALVTDGLLDEVTALVEWPRALIGSFDEEFLTVPPEVLMETMQKNQKYFPVQGPDGRLRPRFITVANIESRSPELIVQGNERVIRPRFADAKFFWLQGLKQPLGDYFARLEGIVFQERLGSVADRSRRVGALAKVIAEAIGTAPELVERAAMLAKCDLATSMVSEFPNLQGTMGRYFAEHGGEPPEVCTAIEEHYRPRFAGDTLPDTACGRALALADRLDLLVGCFGIGQRPTGAKDPYGLRRAAIATLRILIESPLEVDLEPLLQASATGLGAVANAPSVVVEVQSYILGRLESYFADQGIAADRVQAVIHSGGTVVSQLARRIRAVDAFIGLPGGLILAAANKRIANILGKTGIGDELLRTPDAALFSEDAEGRLWAHVQDLEVSTAPLVRSGDYLGVLRRLAALDGVVDQFFADVMVMTEDPLVRENRLMLLRRLRSLFLNVADISLLQ